MKELRKYPSGQEKNDTKLPSQKQLRAARLISSKLNLPLPKEFSSCAYWRFISQHMETSKCTVVGSDTHGYSTRDYRRVNMNKQKEADWRAIHEAYDPQAFLDGDLMKPSWCMDLSDRQYAAHLRSLGYKSSVEEELQRQKDEQMEREWYGR